jgi:carboxyl-terminal processing protease
MLDESAWNEYINQDDPVVKTALRVFKNNAAFPKKPAPKPAKKGKVALMDRIDRVPYDYHSLHKDIPLVANV